MEKITFKDIQKANESILTIDVKGKEYSSVNERIKAFRMNHPLGTIATKIESLVNGVVVMSCEVRDEEDKLLGKAFAYEKENSTFINKTSFIENCCTSATGRALGYAGYGIDTSIASKEEVENAIAQQEKEKQEQEEKKKLLIDIKNLMIEKKVLANEISETFNKNSADMTNEELEEVKKWLEEK